MDSYEFGKIINIFEENREQFIECVNTGELVGIITYFFNRCMNELDTENKLKFADNFCHVIISTLVLSLFPVSNDPKVESEMYLLRQRVYTAINDSINKISNDILKELGIENISTTIH